MTALLVDCDDDVSATAGRLGELLHGKDHVTKGEMAAHIAKALQGERDSHGQTSKQLVDMLAVLGCIRKRVERYRGAHDGVDWRERVEEGREPYDTEEFVGDLERMLGPDWPPPGPVTAALGRLERFKAVHGDGPPLSYASVGTLVEDLEGILSLGKPSAAVPDLESLSRVRLGTLLEAVESYLGDTGACEGSDPDGDESLCERADCAYCKLARLAVNFGER